MSDTIENGAASPGPGQRRGEGGSPKGRGADPGADPATAPAGDPAADEAIGLLLVDTHAHLNAAAFDADRPEVLERALAGLAAVIDVATDMATARVSLGLSAANAKVFSTVGVHPHEARLYDDARLDEVLALADDKRVVGLGEMGLDYHYGFSPAADQRRVFARQLDAAGRRGLPAVIHVREAYDDAFELLAAAGWPAGVLHCFTGTWAEAQVALDHGLFISLSGIVTFKTAGELASVAARVPADRLLLETDSPYLSPVPVRGKRNEPAHVAHTLARVASLRGEPPERLARTTAENACRLFRGLAVTGISRVTGGPR